ncbi:MAG TPA: tRNA (adenosine(37)-N6)-dimethylallyltransferase MiaA [Candidatus Nanoarchaeia archaeon]|nr:tRNA dimethylallyltransferase [uncultured archaeon]
MQKLLVIVGPTGTGKTALALSLAKKFNGEIVSADSRQVFVGMNIGTGKEAKSSKLKVQSGLGKWTVNGIPIYLYDVVSPDQKFSLADYQQLALEKIKEIQSQGKLPILVGGTGLYIQAVTEGLKIPKAAPDWRLRGELEKKSLDLLLSDLEKIDPTTFERIDKNNKRRITRALEVYYQTGQPISALQQKYKADFDILKTGLTGSREELYQKIDERIEQWFKQGFVEEVDRLAAKYDHNLPALTSLGYRQVIMYLEHKLSLEEAKQRMKFEHHSYVRRQMTWNKRDKTIYWFDFNSTDLVFRTGDLVKNWLSEETST